MDNQEQSDLSSFCKFVTVKRIHYELIAPALWTLMVARVETALRPARDWLHTAHSPNPSQMPSPFMPSTNPSQMPSPYMPSQDPPQTPSPLMPTQDPHEMPSPYIPSQDPRETPDNDPPNTPSPVREPEPSPVREVPPSPVKKPEPAPVREAPPSPVPPSPPSPVREAPPSTVPDIMDEPGVDGPDNVSLQDQLRTALALSQTVNALSRRVPWPSACMDRALALHRLMEKRGLPHTLYMGVKKNDKQKLEAHAWITSGGNVLTGGPQHRSFKPVAVYHF